MSSIDSFSKGTVYLIGAGPGRADLITVRGLLLLRQADVILYDRLIAPELLDELPPHAIRIYVGKKMGEHAVRQEDIQRMLVDFARQDKLVVRLKGGDPFVFGRGGEEALALARSGVPFEVVPGVSSAVAAPAYAGIPVTHRGIARSFAVITGHHASNLPPMQTDWRVFSNIPTLVILMGITRIREIVEKLLEAGRPGNTPAAVIEWATTPRQRVVRATLTDLPELVMQEKVESPAVIVIGPVVDMEPELKWFGL
jgi:uroporphyrin-III C-methyltransferase